MKFPKILLLLLALCPVVAARADVSPEKRAEIDTMLRLTGMEKLVSQMMVQMTARMKAEAPQISSEFWDKLSARMTGQSFIDKIVPIYDKYYTIEDLHAVNTFYSSPAGQKILSTLPQVMHESMQIGQEWGKQVAQEVVAEMQAEKKAAAQ
jgi:uncharacterized protein